MTYSPYVPPQPSLTQRKKSPSPRPRFVVTVALMAIGVGGALVGCKTDQSSTASANNASVAPTVTVASPSPAAVAPPAPSAPVSSAPAPVAVDFVMPSLVGIDLQTAQNQVQRYGVLFSVSHDLRGSRHQVLDSGWMVCTQNFAPGQHMTGDLEGKIDFGVVKRGESCP